MPLSAADWRRCTKISVFETTEPESEWMCLGWKPGLKRLRIAFQSAPSFVIMDSEPISGFRAWYVSLFGTEYLNCSDGLTSASTYCGSAITRKAQSTGAR